MADGLNRVMLIGNLGADPELRTTQAGLPVLNMRLATSESWLNGEGVKQERTEWHHVVMWGKRGEALAKLLKKGSRIFVEGGNRTSSFEKDGNTFYKTAVHATDIKMLDGRRDDGDSGGPAPTGGGYQRGAAGSGGRKGSSREENFV